MTSRPLLLTLAALAGLAFAPDANSQVAIFNFDFKKEGPSINYGFYEEAWVVADAVGGPTSWVLLFREGAHRRYITIDSFGSLFYPNKGNTIVGVISAAAASGTPQTTFLAIGEVEQTIKAGNVSVKVPKSLKGYALSADDESELPFDSREGNVGYAGISTMTGSLSTTKTSDANTRNQTVAEALADLVAYVERRGYTEFVLATGTATTGTGTGTTGAGTGTATTTR